MSLVEQYTRPPSGARERRLAWLDLDQLAAAPTDRSFMDRARCAGSVDLSDMFFPDSKELAAFNPAIEFCARCPVRLECLAANLHEEWGVWGGTMHADRKEIRRRVEQRAAA